jgi:ABC-type amino acid transport substrate-binding protein
MKRYLLLLSTLLIIVGLGCVVQACSKKEKIKNFRIARASNWFSMPLMGKEQNLHGFTNDMLQTIAEDEGVQFSVDSISQDALFRSLDSGLYDGILVVAQPTAYTSTIYLYSEPYFWFGPVLVVQKNSDIDTLEEMSGKTIGISRGYPTIWDIKSYPSIVFIPYENILFALENLSRGEIDGVIMPNLPAYIYTQSLYRNKLRVATAPLTGEGLRLVTRQGPRGEQLIEHFDTGLKTIRENGTFDKLIEKWGLFNPQ